MKQPRLSKHEIHLADLGVDAGSYDDDLTVVEDGVGEMMVKVESEIDAPPMPLRVATL